MPMQADDVLYGEAQAATDLQYMTMQACAQGDVAWLQELLSRGAPTNIVNKDGKTPLVVASMNGDVAVVQLLLRHGFPCQEGDREGLSPLHHAAAKGDTQVARLLLDHRADPNATCQLGRTPLHLTASSGNMGVAQLLLEAGVDLDSQDELGWTALHHAAWHGGSDMLELLLSHEADPQVKDKLGRTPGDIARSDGVRNLLQLAQERCKKQQWQRLAVQVVAGEACNWVLGRVLGGNWLAAPEGRFYLGWLVRQQDWQRTQGAPMRLAVPQVPLQCLQVAQRQAALTPADAFRRFPAHRFLHDAAFREGVEVYDLQMKDLRQLLALPAAPLALEAFKRGQWLPAHVKTPPPLWRGPRRLLTLSLPGVLRWVVAAGVKRSRGHVVYVAAILALQHTPCRLPPVLHPVLGQHTRVLLQLLKQAAHHAQAMVKHEEAPKPSTAA